jgi:hypothetical protein
MFLEAVRPQAHAILAGYERQNGHNTRRTAAVSQLVRDRSPDDNDWRGPIATRVHHRHLNGWHPRPVNAYPWRKRKGGASPQ